MCLDVPVSRAFNVGCWGVYNVGKSALYCRLRRSNLFTSSFDMANGIMEKNICTVFSFLLLSQN